MKKVHLYGQRAIGKFALVDDCDFELVSLYRWHIDTNGYAWGWLIGVKVTERVAMHRLILSPPAGTEVDHRDGDKLNNQRSNLRLATRQQNGANQARRKNNSSGYKGVVKQRDKWVARIMVNRKQLYVGQFQTIEEAARAYNAAAIQHFGEFAALNDIPGGA